MVGMLAVMMVANVICAAVATAMATDVVNRAALAQKPTLDHAFAALRRCFFSILAASLLQGMVVMVGMMFCFLPGFLAAIVLILTAPIIVIEGKNPVDALGRSVRLTSDTPFLSSGSLRRWGKICGVLLVVGMIIMALVGVVSMVSALSSSIGVRVGLAIASQAMSAAISPLAYTVPVLLYYDARVEREALDVAMLAQMDRA
jgi:hypothetical protein